VNEPVGVLRLVDPFRAGDEWIPLAPERYRVCVEKLRWPVGPGDLPRIAAAAVREGARIVHAHGHAANLLAVPAARLIRAKVICTSAPATLAEAIAGRSADAVLCATNEEADRCVRHGGIPPAKVCVVHPGADPSRFGPRAPAVRPLIAALGSLYACNGHVDFLEAIARVRRTVGDVEVVCAGEGPMRPVLDQRIAHLGLRATVQLLGHIDEVPALLSRAHAAWTPGPRATIEAMLAGVAVASPWAELIGPELAVRRHDPAALAERLLVCLSAAPRWCEELRNKARAAFSLDAFLARLGALYDAVLAPQRAAA
jgi:glycosyltransferase involved in cell wall biosynthesis